MGYNVLELPGRILFFFDLFFVEVIRFWYLMLWVLGCYFLWCFDIWGDVLLSIVEIEYDCKTPRS
jgi:hypothetical protein